MSPPVSWSTPRPSDPNPNSREGCSTPRALRQEQGSPRSAGRHRGPSDSISSFPGELVDPAGPRTNLSRPRELVEAVGPRTQARVARECWSTSRAIGPQRESLRRGGRHRKHSHTGLSCPGELVDPMGYRRRAQGLRSAGRPRRPSDRIPITRESWSTRRALGHEHESPRSAGRHRGHSDSIESLTGELVDPAGLRNHARDARESWSTARALGPGPESPWCADPTCGTTDLFPSRPGLLVNPAVHRTQAQVARVSWWTLRALGPSSSHPGELVDPVGPRTQARVARQSWSFPQALEHGPRSPGTSG